MAEQEKKLHDYADSKQNGKSMYGLHIFSCNHASRKPTT